MSRRTVDPHARPALATTVSRRRFMAAASTAPALFASACTVGGRDNAAAIAVSKPVTITAWFPLPPTAEGEFLKGQAELFQKTSDKVKVEIQRSGNMQVAVSGGDPPDLWRSSYSAMADYVKQNALEPIDGYLDRRGKNDFFDIARDGSTLDGKMYQWPWAMSVTGVVANRSLFAERNAANLLPKQGPKADWTFDQWKAAVKAVARVTGDAERDVYGTGFYAGQTGGEYYQQMYLWSNGAELYDKDEKKVLLCSPEGVAGLQMIVDLILRDRICPPSPETLNYSALETLFLSKRMGIFNSAPLVTREVERRLQDGRLVAPFEAQFLPVPHAPGKKSTAFVGLPGFLVFRTADRDRDRTRGAMQLGAFLTDNEALKASKPIGNLPSRKSVGNIYADDPNFTTALAVLENPRSIGKFPANIKIRELWQEAAKKSFTGQVPPKQALDEMCRLAEPIMAQQGR